MEERRRLRAQRNRASAEKSRVRRKLATVELENSVAALRQDSLFNKERFTNISSILEDALDVLDGTEMSQAERQAFLMLKESSELLEITKIKCPRTFCPSPHNIGLKL